MGKPTGFLEYDRKDNGTITPAERIKNFCEFHPPLDEAERIEQGARCMNCGVPLCQSGMKLNGMYTGCPLHNLIPEWNDQIYSQHPAHALSRLLKANNFPEFTGRVCPALCEKACMCGLNDDAVTIRENELYIIETAYKEGYMKPGVPQIRSGRRVAVVGSGPAGLACADRLNRRGHLVDVFERDDRIGGLMMYGIPNMKLDKRVIFRRQKLMEKEGVTFRTGVNVGVDITAADLLKEYDAVVLCCGAKKPRPLAIPDADKIQGICYAVDFLKSTTKALLDAEEMDPAFGSDPMSIYSENSSDRTHLTFSSFAKGEYVSARDKNVVIVGGGDTGNDCVGTCIREGCRSVTQIEMMPCPPVTRLPSNPWPQWPRTLKTDYGQEEAICQFGRDPRIYETTVKEAHTTKNGRIKEIVTVKVKFEDRKMVEIPGTERTLKCDLLLIAAGFIGCQDYTADAFGVKRGARGTVLSGEGHYNTNVDKVFTAGDMHRGQSLVVWGIAEGRAAAREVDKYLMGYTTMSS